MNKILMAVSLLVLAGCKSSVKKEEVAKAPSAAAPVVTAPKEAPKPQKESVVGNRYSCQVLDDKRIVEFKKENGRCEIHYTKFGNSSEVAWAEATPSLCSEVYEKIRTNIEGKGFTCQNISKNLAAK